MVKNVAKKELASETWLRLMARPVTAAMNRCGSSCSSFDTDIHRVGGTLRRLLEPLLESWDMDLVTFGMDIVLNRRSVPTFSNGTFIRDQNLCDREQG